MHRAPTRPRTYRAASDLNQVEKDMTAALRIVRERLQPVDDSPEDAAITSLETFVAVALRVFAKTNPSKLHSETRTVEIGIRLGGGVDCLGSVHEVKKDMTACPHDVPHRWACEICDSATPEKP